MYYAIKNPNVDKENKRITYENINDVFKLYFLSEKLKGLWKEYLDIEIPHCRIDLNDNLIICEEDIPSAEKMDDYINNILKHEKDKRVKILKEDFERMNLLTNGYVENVYIVYPKEIKKKERAKLTLNWAPLIDARSRLSYVWDLANN